MYSSIEDVKKELRELCSEYVNILERLREEQIINKETFEICSSSKVLFLEE
ncbi:hypothetical protein [[Clostridium] dakarense]|uniref:hypothetical protein n=1 Tax=Faecalimicrobium dakarense TaxID=1301100 RepID=UPI0004AD4915|nr:hypothetical protein [[Clostridium] dakarense]